MKIKNNTHWQTNQLKAIISRIAKVELADLPAYRRKHLTIEVTYTRPAKWNTNKSYSSGCAYVGGSWMNVRVGKEQIDHIDFAHVIAHEMGHIRGLRHSHMTGRRAYDRVAGHREFYGWADDYPIEKKPIKVKPKVDVQEVRYQRTMTKISNWETKLKRATNALKKLRIQKRYYEKALAAKKPKTD